MALRSCSTRNGLHSSSLSSSKHSLEKAVNSRDVELAASTQSCKDKEQLLSKSGSLLEAAHDAKRQTDESLAIYKENNARLQDKLKASAAEITKGNAIITKLQADGRALKGKLRLKASVMMQQQEHAQQKASELEAADRAAAAQRASAAELRAEKERAEESAASCKAQLVEAQELLRSNQQVIQWLNKELNDAQTGCRPFVSVPSRASTYRPATLGNTIGKPAPFSAYSPATGSSPSSDEKENDIELKGGKTEIVPGSALASLRSRAGIALAAGAHETTNTGTDFPSALPPSTPAI